MHSLCVIFKFCLDITFLDLTDLEPGLFLSPFLEVVRSEDTTGPITGLALSSINKFLCYSLIGKKNFTQF